MCANFAQADIYFLVNIPILNGINWHRRLKKPIRIFKFGGNRVKTCRKEQKTSRLIIVNNFMNLLIYFVTGFLTRGKRSLLKKTIDFLIPVIP